MPQPPRPLIWSTPAAYRLTFRIVAAVAPIQALYNGGCWAARSDALRAALQVVDVPIGHGLVSATEGVPNRAQMRANRICQSHMCACKGGTQLCRCGGPGLARATEAAAIKKMGDAARAPRAAPTGSHAQVWPRLCQFQYTSTCHWLSAAAAVESERDCELSEGVLRGGQASTQAPTPNSAQSGRPHPHLAAQPRHAGPRGVGRGSHCA